MFRLILLLASLADALEPTKYLIVSAPKYGKVDYLAIPGDNTPRALIDTGLKSPQGLAVDLKRDMLFVADPDVRKIFMYKLVFTNGFLMVDDKGASVAAQNVEARWVAVDGVGNLFFTDELTNVIQKVPADAIHGTVRRTTPKMVYDGEAVSEVNRPGGIAVDNFHVFWSNKAIGTQVGSVVKGMEEPGASLADSASSVAQIAKNSNKVYGVCLSQNNVYYTNSEQFMFGVKKNGGAIATISDQFSEPRGCAWDGDGTVFVADKGKNAIFAFPGNMHTLGPAQMTKVADFEDAFGLTVIQSSYAAALFLLAYGL